jgi:hypothetical protein
VTDTNVNVNADARIYVLDSDSDSDSVSVSSDYSDDTAAYTIDWNTDDEYFMENIPAPIPAMTRSNKIKGNVVKAQRMVLRSDVRYKLRSSKIPLNRSSAVDIKKIYYRD